MGEPSGIGPEVAVKAWAALGGAIGGRKLALVGDAEVFRAAAKMCRIAERGLEGALADTGHRVRASPGKPSAANAAAVMAVIEEGVRRVQRGEAAALVTAPIHKSVLTAAGFGFPGHTEYLAALTDARRAVMMLVSRGVQPPLRVVPLTVHVALSAAITKISTQEIVTVAEIAVAALETDFGVVAPRLAVAGLNPHAGEDGTMGNEDREIIAPAVRELIARGRRALGPLPADTLFHDEARAGYDAALCMYHDQALIPLKTLAFWTGVNVTLGLPIVRASPDHGTALDIAGRGIASETSMIAAIETAAEIASRRGL